MESWDCEYEVANKERIEFPEIDGGLLMELLDESHADAEDERLGCVIQSLEAEICPGNMDCTGKMMPESTSSDQCTCEDCGLEDHLMFSNTHHCCHVSDCFNWVDMEMEMGMVHDNSGDDDEMGNWYIDESSDEIIGMAEYVDLREYPPYYYGDSSTDQHVYSSLWQ